MKYPRITMPPSELKLFACLPVICAIGAGGPVVAVSLYVEPLQTELGWSASAVSQLSALCFFAGAVAALGVGKALDRFGARMTMAVSAVVLALSFLLKALTSDFTVMLALSAIAGMATTGASIVPCAYVASRYISCSLAFAMGTLIVGTSLGAALFSVLLGEIILVSDWRMSALVLAGLCMVVLLPLILMTPRHVVAEPEAEAKIEGEPAGVPVITMSIIAVSQILFGGCTMAIMVHLVPMLIERGFETSYTWIFGAINFVPIAGMFLLSQLNSRFGTICTLCLSAAVACASYLAFLGSADTFPIAGLAFFGLAWGISSGAFAQLIPVLVSRVAPTAVLGLCFGIAGFVDGMAATIGPIVAGYLADGHGGYVAVLKWVIVASALSLLPLLYLQARLRKSAAFDATGASA